ncbi:hypothetical protein HMPREF9319_1825 [Streptococcus equinus ATCC 700338]|uniref:Uncharacterized protein n=1 Tax=Streptococcus equinus ATCC 700338 TaxID=864569 RepID=E0PG52_STREI|nr:hypothetical protein HMPREF9319_1825 [Streptococcus equinus ATCC 700338]KXI11400.1 hypothetical protein HMPREF3205_01830 [Streptococcus pasteurianus]
MQELATPKQILAIPKRQGRCLVMLLDRIAYPKNVTKVSKNAIKLLKSKTSPL